jgi:membrane-bound metal-dependent hydrolase YbcI (DUF457 family)
MTLLIGANLPDVDVLAYLWGPGADLAFRRGWTHGVLALALWPFLLTGATMLLDGALRRLRRASLPSGVLPGQVLLLSCVSIWSHPALDTLNTYGVRWLMPFSGRWFYGDTLFIVDPWVWLALGLGVALSRFRASTRPARVALWLAFCYAAAMAVSAVGARRIARAEMTAVSGEPVRRLLVSPVPVNPSVAASWPSWRRCTARGSFTGSWIRTWIGLPFESIQEDRRTTPRCGAPRAPRSGADSWGGRAFRRSGSRRRARAGPRCTS